MAPEVGFEPTTNRLTADRSTTELLWILVLPIERRTVCVPLLNQQVLLSESRRYDRFAGRCSRTLSRGADP
jgi:hypothetical protein